MTTTADAAAAKAKLRADASARRDTIPATVREAASAAIAERAIAIAGAAHPLILAAYMPVWSEVDPGAILVWAFDNDVAVVLPAVVDATTFVYRRYRRDDPLVEGRFGIRAPTADAAVAEPDVIVAPMVAFDRTGMRLGYGGGFYDRAVAALRAGGGRPLLVGVAFAAQEVPAIPAEGHDVRMDAIVTESETFDFRRLS